MPNVSPVDHVPVYRAVEHHAVASPESVALFGRAGCLTFGELNARASLLAERIREMDIPVGGRIGLYMDRSEDSAVAVLGVWKAGCSYVPLSPLSAPAFRTRIAEHARLHLIVSDREDEAPIGSIPGLFMGDLPAADVAPIRVRGVDVDPGSPAWILYTSGSTGEPKGVIGTHRAVFNRCRVLWSAQPVRSNEVFIQNTGLGVVDSPWELWAPLAEGRPVVVVPEIATRDLEGLVDTLERHGISRLCLVPTLLSALLSEVPGVGTRLRRIDTWILSGEPLTSSIVKRFAAEFPHAMLYNQYGLTESCADITSFLCSVDSASAGPAEENIPVGKPIDNVDVYLLNEHLSLAPEGTVAELYFAGEALSMGYWDDAARTASRYLPNPFGAPGSRMFATGDLARRLPSGDIDLCGRADRAVKIRGYKVELDALEAVAYASSPELVHCAALSSADTHGDGVTVMFYSTHPEMGSLRPEELRRRLAQSLPQYMVPSVLRWMPSLPKTATGKIDRVALRVEIRPVKAEEGGGGGLKSIWSQLLQERSGEAGSNFFASGGDSLLAMRLLARVKADSGVSVSFGDFFNSPTLDYLESLVARRAAGNGSLEIPAPFQRGEPARDRLPATWLQEGMWYAEQVTEHAPLYNIVDARWFDGALDLERLGAALAALMDEYEVLRSRFVFDGAALVQEVLSEVRSPLTVVPVSSDIADGELLHMAWEASKVKFELGTAPLFRLNVFSSRADRFLAVATIHHSIGDDHSLPVFWNELSERYRASTEELEDQGHRRAPRPVRNIERIPPLSAGEMRRALDFWAELLRRAPARTEIPASRTLPEQRSFETEIVELELGEELSELLRIEARNQEGTVFAVFLSVLFTYLSRISGQPRVVVGTPITTRHDLRLNDAADAIGCYIDTMPLCIEVDENLPFPVIARRVTEHLAVALNHPCVPLETLVHELQMERVKNVAPVYQVILNMRDGATPDACFAPGLRLRPAKLNSGFSEFDLVVNLTGDTPSISGSIELSRDCFDRDTILGMVDGLKAFATAALTVRELPVSHLPLLGREERERLLLEWNRTAAEYPQGCVHTLFERQVERTPDAVAVELDGKVLTYSELNAQANQLAHCLRETGVGPEVRVGIYLDRSLEMVVAVLGGLKAGGAYVPLDPTYPSERLAFMLADSSVAVLLTRESLSRQLLSYRGTVFSLDGEAARLRDSPAENIDGRARRDNLAYVIYTSGSTGRPKGVMLSHSGVVNYLTWAAKEYEAAHGSGTPVHSSLAFDLTVTSLLAPLTVGGRVVLVREAMGVDGLATLLRQQTDVTLVKITPTHLALLAGQLPMDNAAGRVRTFVVGGENLPAELLSPWRRSAPGTQLINEYGPTETVVGCCVHRVSPADPEVGSVPIGRPIANTQLYVLDDRLEPTLVGKPGELYIAGEGLARGYLGRPGLTAERFLPHPFGVLGDRMYRTGDRVRWLPEGVLEFLGRLDDQVKIRGFRIELGEIESVLLGYAGVEQAVVLVREDVPGDKRLTAYLASGNSKPAVEELREYVRGYLPEHMVPTAWVLLDALPLAPSGKVDRKSLSAPEPEKIEEAFVAPRTPTEEILAGIWTEVLGLDRVGIKDNFIDLGGHSLVAIRVISRIRQLLGVKLPIRAVLNHSTIGALAREVERVHLGESREAPRPIVPVGREQSLPLSFGQQRLWLLEQMYPAGATYNVAFAIGLRGSLHVAALEQALQEIVRRHEVLRTRITAPGGHPVQIVSPAGSWRLDVEYLEALGPDERAETLRRRSLEEATRTFDLQNGPLFQATLLREDQDNTLLLRMHHIISDGLSIEVILRELGLLYAAYLRGDDSPLPDLPVQYADFAVWQREFLRGEILERHLAYWREALAGTPQLLELPTDRARQAVQSYNGAQHLFDLDADLVHRLRTLSSSLGGTLFMTLLAAWQALLARYSGQTDVVVGSPTAGRTREELEGLIGFFVNMLPLRAHVSEGPSFKSLLAQVRENTLRAFIHEDLPFDRLVDGLRVERSTRWHPIFQVAFSYHAMSFVRSLGESGVEMSVYDIPNGTAKFDLNPHITAGSSELKGELEYSTDLFDATTVRRMMEHYRALLEKIAADPDSSVLCLPILSDAERRSLLEVPNHAESTFVAERCLHELLAEQVLRTPDAVAVSCEAEEILYHDLEVRANQLAHYLWARGAGPGVRIGLCLERSAELVIAVLGILKSGAAYVPVDPNYPAERVAFILSDALPTHLVTRQGLLDSHNSIASAVAATGVSVICLDRDAPSIEAHPRTPPKSGVHPEDPAYVIFTSGSTGRPKGVVVTHANVVRLFLATRDWFEFGDRDVWTLFHSYAFDFSVWEIWGALLHGGRLVVVPYWVTRSPEAFRGMVAREGVTVLNQTPSAFRQLVQADESAPQTPPLALRYVIFGGEALDPVSVERWFARHGEEAPRLVNMYGITETTVHVTYCALSRKLLDATAPGVTPIGVPIPDLRVYVLDPLGQPVPFGVTGELYVGGAGVANGYLNRPELTAERFVADPFAAGPATLYRSGDLARLREDGTLEYVGRIDHQVKLRGFRIELGEIEAALAEQPEVCESVVMLRDDPAGDKQLVAYVVLHPEADQDSVPLRQALAGRLPDYMLPSVFVVLPELPLTSQGKLDRRALPEPYAARILRPAYEPPASDTEHLLQQVWQEVLRVSRVGATEDFFATGGDSLRAVQVVAALRERGLILTIRELFQFPTIRGLAQYADGLSTVPTRKSENAIPRHLARISEEEEALLREVLGDHFAEAYPAARMQAMMVAEYARDTLREGIYHPQQGYRLTDEALSVDALRYAIEQLVRRHPMLRTTFIAAQDGSLLQVVRSGMPIPISCHDLRGLCPDEQDQAVAAQIREDLSTPFDLSDPMSSLLRFAIFRRADTVMELLISAHHAIEDGWGNVHFLNTLFEAYADARDGRPVCDAVIPNTYPELVALEAESLASETARAFWDARLQRRGGAWPISPVESPVQRDGRLRRSISEELAAALRAAASRQQVALKTMYLSPFLDVVSNLAREEDACVGVVWNRRSERLSNPLTALGLFWNLLPVHRPSGLSATNDRIKVLHDDMLRADVFSQFPLAEIIASNGGHEPFFATFNFVHFHHWSAHNPARGVQIETIHEYDRFHLPFNLLASIEPDGAVLHIEYDARFFELGEVEAVMEDYIQRLRETASLAARS